MSNMDTNFDLQEYLTKGVEGVIADAVKAPKWHFWVKKEGRRS